MNLTYPPSKKNVILTLRGINADKTCGFQFRLEFRAPRGYCSMLLSKEYKTMYILSGHQ